MSDKKNNINDILNNIIYSLEYDDFSLSVIEIDMYNKLIKEINNYSDKNNNIIEIIKLHTIFIRDLASIKINDLSKKCYNNYKGGMDENNDENNDEIFHSIKS